MTTMTTMMTATTTATMPAGGGTAGTPSRFTAIARIIAEVAGEAGLTVPMITGDRRSRGIVEARHLAYWRAARETGASLAAIGRAFGDRDHTTILHGIRKHEERMAAARPARPARPRR